MMRLLGPIEGFALRYKRKSCLLLLAEHVRLIKPTQRCWCGLNKKYG
jgi:hypothetical protein